MEYAAGGELFGRICTAGRFSEDEVKQIYICNFSYCSMIDENDLVVLSNFIFVSTNNRLASSSNSLYPVSATVIPW